MLLVGSRAMMFRAPFILKRKPFDFDFIAYEDEANKWIQQRGLTPTERFENKIIVKSDVPIEFELIQNGSAAEKLIQLVDNDSKTIRTEFGMVPNLNLLFTLKASHRYLKNSPHFWKTAIDYHAMKRLGCKIDDDAIEFFLQREKETYTYKHPKLNVTKDIFFRGDEVEYRFDHDSIHEAMKLAERPAYTYFQKDGAQVACDKDKFFNLSNEQQLNSVLEETYVLALERSQIPYGDKIAPKQSFMMALSKVCSSITSGWWREFAYEHIFDALKRYDDKYVERFRDGIVSGVVKPYEKR